MCKKYLSMVVGKSSVNKYFLDSKISVNSEYINMVFLNGDFIAITDFYVDVSCAIKPMQTQIKKEHLKTRYRKFGKTYLNELDKIGGATVNEEYTRSMLKHKLLLQSTEQSSLIFE